jgi:hypothetical protein
MASLDDTTTNNRLFMFQSGTVVDSRVVFGGYFASTSNGTVVLANTPIKASLAYAVGTNQAILTVNGISGSPNSPVGGFSPTRLVIGSGVAGLIAAVEASRTHEVVLVTKSNLAESYCVI